MMAVPTVRPGPVTTWTRPSGRPASSSSSKARRAVNGVCESGLMTTPLPATRAAMRVGHGQHQRVVPRRDHADDALGDVVHPGRHQAGQRAQPALGAQRPGGEAGVVPGGDRLVHDLLERPHPGLAVLGLDEVEQLVLPVEDQVVVAEQDRGPLLHRRRGPRPLDLPGPGERGGHVLGRAHGHLAEHLAGERATDLAALPALGHATRAASRSVSARPGRSGGRSAASRGGAPVAGRCCRSAGRWWSCGPPRGEVDGSPPTVATRVAVHPGRRPMLVR